MKHLKDQIKFIDIKLLPLYGFKNIVDYTHILCISDLDNLKLDLVKLNELIDEFRKVFNSKNFSLHKTQYKILTKSQGICLLKTCLEITSIPFDINMKKNKKYMRLICKNNILENYINTLKMAENSSFKQKDNFEQKVNSEQKDNFEQIVEHVFAFNTNGYKDYTAPKIITKEQLNDGIKKINNLEFFLIPKKLIKNKNNYYNDPFIEINMKNYVLNNKILKSFCVKFVSKKINNEQILSENYIEHLVKNIIFKINIGGSIPYNWGGKFMNDTNCIIDNLILPIKYLQFNQVMLYLTNIKEIMYLFENLEIKISCEYVDLYAEIDNIIQESSIEQLFCMETNKFNILRIMRGMASNIYDEFQNLDKLPQNNFASKYKKDIINKTKNFNSSIESDLLCMNKNLHELNKKDIINESELFVGKSLFFGNFEGFEIEHYFKNFSNQNASRALDYKYEFVCWNIFDEVNAQDIEYYRITDKNLFKHFYKINLSKHSNVYTISKLQILSNFNLNKISKTHINYSHACGKEIDIPVKCNFQKKILTIDLEGKHISLFEITDIIIQFESEYEEELIGEKITVIMKAFEWAEKHRRFFATCKMITFDFDNMNV